MPNVVKIKTMTLSQGYRMVQAAHHRQPCLDYPYIGIEDIDEDELKPFKD